MIASVEGIFKIKGNAEIALQLGCACIFVRTYIDFGCGCGLIYGKLDYRAWLKPLLQ